MRSFKSRFLTIAVVVAFLGLVSPFLSYGRGGGGHSFSGGRSSGGRSSGGGGFSGSGSHSAGSSGRSSGSGTVFYSNSYSNRTDEDPRNSEPLPLKFLLVLVLFVVIFLYLLSNAKKVKSSDDLDFEIPHRAGGGGAHPDTDAALESLLHEDAEFSMPLFKDFCYALYSTLHHARGKGAQELDRYRAYLSEEAVARLLGMNHGVHPILGVVIGAFDLVTLELGPTETRISIEFEANYTEDLGAGKQQSYYSEESWTFIRQRGVKSRTPDKIRTIACPACGSPAQSDQHGKCPACGKVIRSGIYDWFVEQIVVVELSNRPPLLTTTVEEEGTDLPTVYDPHLQALEAQLFTDLKTNDLGVLNERIQRIFYELQKCWSLRNLKTLRPYETDALFETHLYWIEEYKKQHLVNRLDQVKVERVELCKVFYDAHYISVTVRVFASMKDWTETEQGVLVCGSKSSLREFTEYWTLIRSRKLVPPKGDFNQCPACGAELQISQAGVCSFCSSKITSGEFDWVLSSIEQDEAYHG